MSGLFADREEPLRPRRASIELVSDELLRGRRKFPGSRFLLAALTEEVGELAKAFLQNLGPLEVQKEAAQVAAVAIRILEESDTTFDDITKEESQP